MWKSHQKNCSMVRSRGASRKPLCIFPEDLPMSTFYTHGTYLLSAAARLGNASAAPPGQPKHTAQRWLCPQPPPRDPRPHVGSQVMPRAAVAYGSSHRLGLSWPCCCFSHLQALGWTLPAEQQQARWGPAPPSQVPGRHPLFIRHLNPFSKLCGMLNGPFGMSELRDVPRWTLSCPYLFC